MTERDAPVTEDELHAYVDGALPADRIAAVEARLASDPEAASRVAAWRAQTTSIRAKWERIIDEPVPDRLRLERIALRASGTWRKIAAAAAVAFVIGVAAGWYARRFPASTATSRSRAPSPTPPSRRTVSISTRSAIRSRCGPTRRISCRGFRAAWAPPCARPISRPKD